MDIYLARNNEQAGPYSLEELNNMLGTGDVVLTDLAWHNGMAQWQPLGEITAGQNYYTGTPAPNAPPQDRWAQPPQAATNSGASSTMSTSAYDTPKTNLTTPAAQGSAALAPVSKRLIAVFIDQLLFILVLLPAMPYISISLSDMQKLDTPEKAFAFYDKLLSSLPTTVQGFIAISMVVLFVLQIYLIIKRGQTIGKLLLGIRIVDIDSIKVPSMTNIFLLRTLVTNVSYNLPLVGPFIFIADCIMLFFAQENRTLHDKLAKTKVVVAQPEQLDKL